MGLLLLKWFGWYFLYVGIGAVFFALHTATMLKGRFCWLFWPDVDVKFISHRFVDEISDRFCYYIIFLWPFRLLHILFIFMARIVGLIGVLVITSCLMFCDLTKKEAMKISHYLHNQNN